MSTPTPQQIYRRVLETIDVNSPAHPVRDYIRKAVQDLSTDLDPLAILEMVDGRLPLLTRMLVDEQVRAVSEGVAKFEILGSDAPVLKGFAVPLATDTLELSARRQRAALSQPVWNALLSLTPSEFEALWRILVEQLGGHNFELHAKTGDGGIDFTAEFNLYRLSSSLPHVAQEWLERTEYRSTLTIIGQAKHTPDSTVAPAILRELVGTMFLHTPETQKGERKGSTGMLVTTGRFSSRAEAQARRANLILLDGEWVVSAIINFGLGIEEVSSQLIFDQARLRDLVQQAPA